jgi:hypothetical protein
MAVLLQQINELPSSQMNNANTQLFPLLIKALQQENLLIIFSQTHTQTHSHTTILLTNAFARNML